MQKSTYFLNFCKKCHKCNLNLVCHVCGIFFECCQKNLNKSFKFRWKVIGILNISKGLGTLWSRLAGLADIKTSSLHMMASFSGLTIFCGRKQLRTTRQRVVFFFSFLLKSNSNHFDVWSTKNRGRQKQVFTVWCRRIIRPKCFWPHILSSIIQRFNNLFYKISDR